MSPIIVAVAALCISLAAVPLVIRFAVKEQLFDSVGGRKIHTGRVPRLGGIAVFAAWSIAMAGGIAVGAFRLPPEFQWEQILVGIAIMFAVGFIDDLRGVRPLVKLFFQIIGAFLVVAGEIAFRQLIIPFGGPSILLGNTAGPITILWIVALTNAINLIDGMDGLAGGVSLLVATAFAAFYAMNGQATLCAASAALAGAILGFLAFNKPKAKIFLGDGGSYFLGTILAILPLLGKSGTVSDYSTFLVALPLMLPLLDMVAAVIRRVRDGRSISSPDREHIHHKLLDLGFGTWGVLLRLYALTALCCAVFVAYPTLPSPWADAAAFAAALIVLAYMAVKHFAYRKKAHA